MESIYPEEITTFAAVVLYGVPVAVAVLSYLLGCINGAIATSHLFYHDDVRRHGSGNAGLTNFYRNYGAKCAIVVIAFDMLKAVGAVCLGGYFLGHLLGWGVIGKYFGALFCIIGHMMLPHCYSDFIHLRSRPVDRLNLKTNHGSPLSDWMRWCYSRKRKWLFSSFSPCF